MKNYEKYADEIREYKDYNFCGDFVVPHILKSRSCGNTNCEQCKMLQTIWLMEEYEEPEVDWSKVKVDTPIMVRDSENTEWVKKHFAKVENGVVYAWNNGKTSWTTEGMVDWKYAKLAEDEKEPEIDWSKVEVDTPILVRDDGVKWVKRHFAKYENGSVYAWKDSHTSWTSLHNDDVTFWSYAKLAEDEENE